MSEFFKKVDPKKDEMGKTIMESVGVSLFELSKIKDPEARKKAIAAKVEADRKYSEMVMELAKKGGVL